MALLAEAGPDVMVLAMPEVGIGSAENDEGKLFCQMVAGFEFAADALELPRAELPAEWAAEAEMYL